MSTSGERRLSRSGGRGARGMRHAATALLVVALAAVVAACGSGTQQNSGGGGDSSGGKTTLTLKHISGTDQTALAPLIAAFEKQNPNIKINASFAPTDQLQTSLRAQLGAGNAPDIFVVWPGNGSAMSVQQLAPTGVLADLSDQSWVKQVADRPQARARRQGQDVHVLARHDADRRDLQQEGLQGGGRRQRRRPRGRELLAACDKIKKAGKIPFAVGNADAVGHPAHHVRDRAVDRVRAGPEPRAGHARRARRRFANSGWRDACTSATWSSEEAASSTPSPNGTTFEQQQLDGRHRARPRWRSRSRPWLPPITARRQEQRRTSAMFPFPANDAGTDLKIPAGLGAGYGVSANSKHQAEAKKFIAFLGQPENAATYAKENIQLPLTGGDNADIDPAAQAVRPVREERQDRAVHGPAAGRTPRCSRRTSPASRSSRRATRTSTGAEEARRGVPAEVIT